MAKFDQAVDVLKTRIQRGDYLVAQIPPERVLAEDIGVSRVTARKAVQQLIDEGLLLRRENGRLMTNSQPDKNGIKQVAFLAPAYMSWNFEWWRTSIERCAEKYYLSIRPVDYVHWNDPIVLSTLDRFTGVFLIPLAEETPDMILERIRSAKAPVVVLDRDAKAWGIPSIQMFPADCTQKVLDYLFALGHRNIACLSTQPTNPDTDARIQQWALWRAARQLPGELYNCPVQPYQCPMAGGHSAMLKILKNKNFTATAVLCTAEPAAIGAMRAMRDNNLIPGKDLSICAVNDERLARFLYPSLTSLEVSNPEPYINLCLQWMLQQGNGWVGPLNLYPSQINLFKGESTASHKSA